MCACSSFSFYSFISLMFILFEFLIILFYLNCQSNDLLCLECCSLRAQFNVPFLVARCYLKIVHFLYIFQLVLQVED
jgi:hypothetical protein